MLAPSQFFPVPILRLAESRFPQTLYGHRKGFRCETTLE